MFKAKVTVEESLLASVFADVLLADVLLAES